MTSISSVAAAVAEFVSVTKDPTVAHRPLPFVLQLVRTHQASGTRQRLVHALFFFAGSYPAFSIGARARVLSMN